MDVTVVAEHDKTLTIPDVNQDPKGSHSPEILGLPQDWSVERIGDHTTIKTGAKNTQDRQVDGRYPFFVRSQTVEHIDSYSYDGEAVLTAGDGVGTGKVFHYIIGKFDVHQRVYRISDFSPKLDGLYFYYQFSTRFYNRIMLMTAKSSVDSVRMEMIAGMQIPLPSIAEQRTIAQALSNVDKLISSLDHLIAKKQDLKRATMQQLLTGKTRLPGFEGEWEDVELGDIANVVMGQSPSSSAYNLSGHGLPLIQGNADIKNRWTIDHIWTTQITKRCSAGDLILTVRAPVGSVARTREDSCLGRGVCAIQPSVSTDFLFYSLVLGESRWLKLEQGSTFTAANSADVKKFEISVPKDLIEQETIARIVSDIDAEIDALKQRRAKTKAIKQGMMQELLTGRTRLVTPGGAR